ncbi:MAG: response regulator [Rhodobiaceae bacterium]|nr:response regulator [Rhodobiaceae bacterium]MCC0042355.1 response regulator [Rhodobiaceae bacterium]
MEKIDFSQVSVLVVDDNMHMRKIVRALLMAFGVRQVQEAEDGASALEAFEQNSPDIIITDWVMPIIDGLELVQMIRRPDSSNNPFVPIIMLTGHAEKRRVMQARDAGVHEFLCKPISARSLYLRLYSVIAHPRPFVKTTTYFGPDRRRFANPLYKGPERREKRALIDIEDEQPDMNQIDFDAIDAGDQDTNQIDFDAIDAGGEDTNQIDFDAIDAGDQDTNQIDFDAIDAGGQEEEQERVAV